MFNELQGKTVLVTGGTGFIGGRLIEKLILNCGARVRTVTRNLPKAVRIARFPVELIRGDLAELENVENAMRGCDAVFHCAWNYDPAKRGQNLKGTWNILAAAQKLGVRRVVYTSTVAIYNTDGVETLTEETPYQHSGNPYSDAKREAEKIVRAGMGRGIPAAIIQPSNVYGPWSAIYSWHPIWQLKRGEVVLADNGKGVCNAVYIDDVVDAHLLAAVRPEAAGQAFLISGEKPVTWREFYAAYEEMLGVKAVVTRSDEEIAEHIHKEKFYHSRLGQFRAKLGQAIQGVRTSPGNSKASAGSAVTFPVKPPPKWVYMPNEDAVKRFKNRTSIDISKARTLIGYQPNFDLKRGMRYTRLWAAWANLL